jgi:hypothetical protein
MAEVKDGKPVTALRVTEKKDEGVRGKFFLAQFRDGRLLLTKEGHRALRVDFSVQMSDAKSKVIPPAIRAEWAAMKAESLIEEVKISGERLPVMIVETRMYAERAGGGMEVVNRLERVTLKTVRSKDATTTEFRFSVTAIINDDVWKWLRHSFGTPLWVSLKEAQGKLLVEFEAAETEAESADDEDEPDKQKGKTPVN